MCTITFFPAENGDWIITDNRDEAVSRPALLPKVYPEMGARLFYPKDIRGGGTWFGASNFNRAICLMNGAFKPHKRKHFYRKSRGVVVKELLIGNDFKDRINTYDFIGIEAFYALTFLWKEEKKIYELIWDEEKLTVREADAGLPHLWTSVMTYSPEQHKEKEHRFFGLLQNSSQNGISASELWDFHHSKGKDTKHEGLIINRGILRTTSITQLVIRQDSSMAYRYEDLLSETEIEGVIGRNDSIE